MPNAHRFYVYQHVRIDTNTVFYVGKGSGNRLWSTRATHRSQRWLRTVAKAGGFSATKVVDNVDEDLSFLVEAELIDRLKRLGVSLCNMTFGGEGTSGYRHTPEALQKMRVKWKEGRVMSDEQRKLIAEVNRTREVVEQTRAKMSKAHAGRTHTEQSRKKMSDARVGRKNPPITQSTRDKLSVARSGVKHPMWGKHHSEASKRKISEAKRGKPLAHPRRKVPDEARARMSEAHSGQRSHLFGTTQKSVTCPHCEVTGGDRTMQRWHFSRCKEVLRNTGVVNHG